VQFIWFEEYRTMQVVGKAHNVLAIVAARFSRLLVCSRRSLVIIQNELSLDKSVIAGMADHGKSSKSNIHLWGQYLFPWADLDPYELVTLKPRTNSIPSGV